MLVVLLGPPGAGKGTQSELLRKFLGVPSLSTGELLRAAKASGSSFGKLIKEKLDTGQLIEDEHVVELVIDELKKSDCQNGAILDGFPRTLNQAEKFDGFLSDVQKKIDLVIELCVPFDLIMDRLQNRFLETEEPRPEDGPEFVTKRIKIFEEMTLPLSQYYQSGGRLALIDGSGSAEDVFHRIKGAIAKLTNGRNS